MFTGEYCGGMGPAGWLLMIGFWAAVIAVIVWAVTRLFPKASTGGRSPAALHQRPDTQELLLDQRRDRSPDVHRGPAGTHRHRSAVRAPAATATATTAGPTCHDSGPRPAAPGTAIAVPPRLAAFSDRGSPVAER